MGKAWRLGFLVLLLGCVSDPTVDPALTLERTGRFAHKSFVVERLPSGRLALGYSPGLARYVRMALLLVGAVFTGAIVLNVVSGRRQPSERAIAAALVLSLLGGGALCTQETALARTVLDPHTGTLSRTETDSLGRITVHPPVPLAGARFVVAERTQLDPFGTHDRQNYDVLLQHPRGDNRRVVSFDRRPPAESLRNWLAARLPPQRGSGP